MKTISEADANRQFFQILRNVQEGETYLVTSDGTPVAILAPASGEFRKRAHARDALLARLRALPATSIARWTRDELYGDDTTGSPEDGDPA